MPAEAHAYAETCSVVVKVKETEQSTILSLYTTKYPKKKKDNTV